MYENLKTYRWQPWRGMCSLLDLLTTDIEVSNQLRSFFPRSQPKTQVFNCRSPCMVHQLRTWDSQSDVINSKTQLQLSIWSTKFVNIYVVVLLKFKRNVKHQTPITALYCTVSCLLISMCTRVSWSSVVHVPMDSRSITVN